VTSVVLSGIRNCHQSICKKYLNASVKNFNQLVLPATTSDPRGISNTICRSGMGEIIFKCECIMSTSILIHSFIYVCLFKADINLIVCKSELQMLKIHGLRSILYTSEKMSRNIVYVL